MPFFTLLLVSSCAGYGWTIQRQVNIACPLILQFIAGFATTSLTNAASTLMIDLVPDQSSSVIACVRELIHELEEVLIAFMIRTIYHGVFQVPHWCQSSILS